MTNLKASFIKFPEKQHQYKKFGCVVVHNADAKFSATQFDFRYMGPRSKLGKFLRQLQKEGVDVSDVGKITSFVKAHGEPDELTMAIAKRLYEAMGKRTFNKDATGKQTLTKNEKFDWKKPAAKHTRFYKLAEYLLKNFDQKTVLDIVNVIAGYA